uniref:Aspartyl/asparaginy/proline hydroxylase domain-containing protein n=1 Tax=Octactis speculum TaxID=3111310 RepID=A0A7S2CG00_9STRA
MQSGHHDGDVVVCGKWREQVLFGRGGDSSRAPRTCALLESVLPDAVELCHEGAGEIIFSLLDSRTHIAPHCAPSNLRLTAHLGLIIPSQSQGGVDEECAGAGETTLPERVPRNRGMECGIRVGSEWRKWEEGKVLIFDDSFEHEVINFTPHYRAILLIRFWHPDIAAESSRQAALKQSHDDREASFRLRKFPPLPQSCSDALCECISGARPCPECQQTGTGWTLSFAAHAAEGSDVTTSDYEGGTTAALQATCVCGAVLRSK